MIKVQVIHSADPTVDQLEQFKQYASVPTDQRDALLQGCLKRAMLEVQAFANVGLLPSTIRVDVSDARRGEPVKLYQGGTKVLSLTDQNGNAIRYRYGLDFVIPEADAEVLRLEYQNEVLPATYERLRPVLWEYATALYDGADAADLAKILKQTYGSC